MSNSMNYSHYLLTEAKTILFSINRAGAVPLVPPPVIVKLRNGEFIEIFVQESKFVQDEFQIMIKKVESIKGNFDKRISLKEVYDINIRVRLISLNEDFHELLQSIEWRYGDNRRIEICLSLESPLWFDIRLR